MQRLSIVKLLLACSLALFGALAFALPSPKDIDAAVNAGRLTQAESMLREVIQEKPQSAKAHYELGQVLARQEHYADAQIALKKAKELDPALKFAASPEKFNETFDKVSRMAQGPSTASLSSSASSATKPAVAAASVPAPTEPAFPMSYVLIAAAGLVILALVFRRSKTNAAPAATGFSAAPSAAMPGGTATAPRGFGAEFTPNAPANRPGYAPSTQPAQPMGGGMGSGMGGAVIGGLAGVAAGYALSKALEGDQHNNSSNAKPTDNNNSYVPIDSPAQPDLGGFDAGSDGGWDDASSSGGDDGW